MSKTCLDCKYWRFDGGEQGYSELTPGSDMYIQCEKGHWELHNGDADTAQCFRDVVALAVDCPDFEQVDEPIVAPDGYRYLPSIVTKAKKKWAKRLARKAKK